MMKTPYMVLQIQDEEDLKAEICRKQDEFLDVLSFYMATRCAWVHEEVRLKAYELHLLDPTFQYSV